MVSCKGGREDQVVRTEGDDVRQRGRENEQGVDSGCLLQEE